MLHPRQLSTPHKTNVVRVPSSNLSRSFCSAINITSSQEFRVFQTGEVKAKLARSARQARWEHPSRVSRAPRRLRAKRTRIACCTFKNIELRVLQTKLKAQTRPSPGLLGPKVFLFCHYVRNKSMFLAKPCSFKLLKLFPRRQKLPENCLCL